MGLFPSSNISCDRSLQAVLAKLLKYGSPEDGILQGSGAKADQGIRMSVRVAFLINFRYPESKKAEDAAGPLEAGKGLLLRLKDGEDHGVKWICCLKHLFCMVDWKPTRNLIPVGLDPGGICFAGLFGLIAQKDSPIGRDLFRAPFKQSAAYDLRGFSLGRYHHCFSVLVHDLLEAVVVGKIGLVHLHL
jgi:hypothetical protein